MVATERTILTQLLRRFVAVHNTHAQPSLAAFGRMAKKYREVRKALQDAGWSVVRVTGSHERWVHPDGRRTTVAGKSNDDVPSGTLARIRRETGLKELR